tara:strand:- start:583 stop:1575 length:993 start_codon:yes stop_codon:yes gene_type:complete
MSIQFRPWFKRIFLVFVFFQLSACATNFRQGLQNLENYNYPEALKFFEKDAQIGYRIPAIHAANLYIIDYQVPRNLEKSRYYLDMALKTDYGLYDQVYDYYIPLVKAYQLLADEQQTDKSEAFTMLNYEKYQDYSWALNVLGLCNLVGYGTELNLDKAKMYFDKAFENRINDHNNAFYAWWLSVYPDPAFRNPKRALSMLLDSFDEDELIDKPTFQDTLAAVYAGNGQFDKALETQQLAIALLNENIEKYAYMSVYQAGFESRLELYKQGKPWIYSYDDIKRCGYNSKRCLKVTPAPLSIESDNLGEILLIHLGPKSHIERTSPGMSDFH